MYVCVVMRVIGMSYNLFGEESVNKTTATPMKLWVMVHISLRNIDTLTPSNVLYDTEKPLFYILNTFLNIKECFIPKDNLYRICMYYDLIECRF